MDSSRAAFRTGFFVIAGVFAILALIFFLSGATLHPGVQYETYFQESVQGLDVGTAVKFRGVTIGHVTDVGLISAEYPPPKLNDSNLKVYQQVVVRFVVDPKKVGHVDAVGNSIAHGLRVQIEPQGITGLSYLDLSFVNPAQFPVSPVPWTPDSTVIPSIPSTLTQIQDAVEQIMSSLSKVDAAQMVTDIQMLMTTLTQEITSGDAHKAIANANVLLTTLTATVQQTNLPATSADIRNLAAGPQTQQIIAELNQTTAQLAKVSGELPALVASSQSAINQANETTSDLQAELIPILGDLKATTENLRALTGELSHNPSSVIFGAQPPPDAPPPQGATP